MNIEMEVTMRAKQEALQKALWILKWHKKSPTFACKALIYLAPPDGLEPPT